MTHNPARTRAKHKTCAICETRKHPSNFRKDSDMCASCRTEDEAMGANHVLHLPTNAFGAKVIQDNAEIAKAWAAAMGGKRFTSLVYR